MSFRRALLGLDRGIEGTVYGTIVTMSVIAAGSARADAARLAGLVVASAIVFWFAHVYARALEESVESRTRLTFAALRHLARDESAIPLASVAPTLALLAGAVGIFRDATAVWVALGLGVATLGATGLRYARIERLASVGTALSVALNLALGLSIVVLKAALSH